jgi:hypothetical protein
MVAVPGETPVIAPDVLLAVAIVGSLVVQMPPVGVEESVVDRPVHADATPRIVVGAGLTVTVMAGENAELAPQVTNIRYDMVYGVPDEEIVGLK